MNTHSIEIFRKTGKTGNWPGLYHVPNGLWCRYQLWVACNNAGGWWHAAVWEGKTPSIIRPHFAVLERVAQVFFDGRVPCEFHFSDNHVSQLHPGIAHLWATMTADDNASTNLDEFMFGIESEQKDLPIPQKELTGLIGGFAELRSRIK